MTIFVPLLLLTGFYMLLEISFFIQCNQSYFYVFNIVSANLTLPLTMLPDILLFLIIQLLLHFFYCVLIFLATLSISNLLSLSENKKLSLGMGLWALGLVTIITANGYFFPNSKFSVLLDVIFFYHTLTKILLLTLSFVSFYCCLLFLIDLILTWKKTLSFAGFLIIAYCGFSWLQPQQQLIPVATRDKPNVIIIGVDALRPDFLHFFGHQQSTPFFDQFLQHAVVFPEAVTPLARTFPSWTSILTGLHPKQSGARTNLMQQDKMALLHTLPTVLQQHGYETIYATDETRFSNIDKNFGFDRLVTPPIGLNDFLLGTFNDFPISNLLINTVIGKWLFPYSYANRPVFFSYDPDSFLHLLRPVLAEQRSKSLFLAVHFCLPHHPYVWDKLSAERFPTVLSRYEKSVQRVDQQLQDFFKLLKQNHLLDHAIVVLLSDHGEAFELSGDRITETDFFVSEHKKSPPHFYPPSLEDEAIDQSAGHGTDVLGLSQYQSLLAFRTYGLTTVQAKVVPGVVSLLDLYPTIMQLLGFHPQQTMNGISLIDNFYGQHKIATSRHIFIESDFSPESIRTVYPEMRKVVLEGAQFFQINDKTLRLTIKEDMLHKLIHNKQYADIYQHWMLALYPQQENVYLPILINLNTGAWTDDLSSAFAKQSPASVMLTAMQGFYGSEIGKIDGIKY